MNRNAPSLRSEAPARPAFPAAALEPAVYGAAPAPGAAFLPFVPATAEYVVELRNELKNELTHLQILRGSFSAVSKPILQVNTDCIKYSLGSS